MSVYRVLYKYHLRITVCIVKLSKRINNTINSIRRTVFLFWYSHSSFSLNSISFTQKIWFSFSGNVFRRFTRFIFGPMLFSTMRTQQQNAYITLCHWMIYFEYKWLLSKSVMLLSPSNNAQRATYIITNIHNELLFSHKLCVYRWQTKHRFQSFAFWMLEDEMEKQIRIVRIRSNIEL